VRGQGLKTDHAKFIAGLKLELKPNYFLKDEKEKERGRERKKTKTHSLLNHQLDNKCNSVGKCRQNKF